MDKQMKIAVVLSAYDKMSAVVSSSVDRTQRKLASLQKTQQRLNSFGNNALIGGGIATAFFATTVKAAEESEQAGNRLKQVFKSMGEQNNNAADAALNYASKLQMQIGVEDEVIAATQAKIATFKSVSNEAARMAGVFDRATAAAFDMQATGFGEASQNAVQLGKALEDPIKGITSLRKSGITFTEAERKKIQALVDSGQKMKAQNLILAAVEKQVGGVAKATATGTAKAKVAWSEVSESIGKMLLPKINALADVLVNNVIPKVQAFIEKHPELVKWVAGAGVALLGLGAAAKTIAFVMGGLGPLFNGVSTAIRFAGTAFTFVSRIFMANPIGLVITAIALGVYLIIRNWDKIKAFFSRLWDVVKSVFQKTWQWIKNMFLNYTPAGLVMKHWDKIKAWFSNLWENVKGIFTKTWEWIKSLFLNYTPAGIIYKHWDEIVQYFTRLWDKIKNVFSNAWKSIKSGITSLFGSNSEVDAALNKTQAVMARANRQVSYTVTNGGVPSAVGTAAALSPNAVNNATNNMQFSPTINLSGGATKDDAKVITDALQPTFEKQMKAYTAKQERVKY